MPISKNDFRQRYALRERTVTLKSGDIFKVRGLNMKAKAEIRNENTHITLDSKGKAEFNRDSIDLEGMQVDTIIAACIEPKFDFSDREWMLEELDSTFIQELYEAIETPVQLTQMSEDDVKN